jgi:hypothetical protein
MYSSLTSLSLAFIRENIIPCFASLPPIYVSTYATIHSRHEIIPITIMIEYAGFSLNLLSIFSILLLTYRKK